MVLTGSVIHKGTDLIDKTSANRVEPDHMAAEEAVRAQLFKTLA